MGFPRAFNRRYEKYQFHAFYITNILLNITAYETNFIPDVETFIEMFKGYKNIVDNAEAFMEIQEKYQVNAAFAACVTIAESGGGTGWAALHIYLYHATVTNTQ